VDYRPTPSVRVDMDIVERNIRKMPFPYFHQSTSATGPISKYIKVSRWQGFNRSLVVKELPAPNLARRR